MSEPADRAAFQRSLPRLAERLDGTFSRLLSELGGDSAFLAFRPGLDRWSAAEILEHVSLTNHFLLLLATKLRRKSLARLDRGEPWPAGTPGHPCLDGVAQDRRRWPHPEHMTPTGRPPGETTAKLAEQRLVIADHLERLPAGEGTLARIRISVLPAGQDKLDLYQLLEFLGRHAERHLLQIEANRASHQRTAAAPTDR